MYVCLPSCSDRTQNTRFSSLPRDSLHGWKNLISENRHDIASFHSGSRTSPLKLELLEFWKVSLQVMAAESEVVGVTNRLNETPRHFEFGATMSTLKKPTLRKANAVKHQRVFEGNNENFSIFSALAFRDVGLLGRWPFERWHCETEPHFDTLRSKRHRHANIHFSAAAIRPSHPSMVFFTFDKHENSQNIWWRWKSSPLLSLFKVGFGKQAAERMESSAREMKAEI